jgi:cytochrome c peroxidase
VKRRFVLALLPLAAALATGAERDVASDDALAGWREAFARPSAIPAPPGNPVTPEKVALGRALFADTRLSGDGTMACVTCHDPALSFSDGVARRPGHDGEPLPRRTPSLWNLAWGLTFFWDGRAPTLEAQASGPIENLREMGGDIAKAAARLAADPGMAARFAAAFPEDPRVTEANIRAALAGFERTLVSPKTRFDRWVEGEAALDPDERTGFALFVGKAGCVACHKGWRFTDEAFHDIGLAGADLGRGEALKLAAANHAFKTPSLRERVWTAPYMHDGSLATLEAVVTHYAERVIERPTLSADLKRPLDLSPEERGRLVAFLATLSSDDPPRPAALPARVETLGAPAGPAVAASEIRQKGRRFTPGAVAVKAGEALRFVNDDSRTHNVRVDDPRMPAFSEAQEPGDTVVLGFPEAGEFAVTCGIHPEMRLDVVVTPR